MNWGKGGGKHSYLKVLLCVWRADKVKYMSVVEWGRKEKKP